MDSCRWRVRELILLPLKACEAKAVTNQSITPCHDGDLQTTARMVKLDV